MSTSTNVNSNFDWIAVDSNSETDQQSLVQKYQITEEMLGYAVDPAERARVEVDKDAGIGLIIYNVLTDDTSEIVTAPMGIMLKSNQLFTFTSNGTEYVNDFVLHSDSVLKLPDLDQQEPIDAVIGLMYRTTVAYLDKINQIDQRRSEIQSSLKSNPQHSAINELMELETNLVYYLTALKANTNMLQDLQRLPIPINDGQKEHIDDISVESQQGLEMAQMASDIVEKISNAYSNLLDNNLNNTMKFLTAYSVIITVPTIVSGFFGENVRLPFQHNVFGWQITILITVVLGYLMYLMLKHYKFFDR